MPHWYDYIKIVGYDGSPSGSDVDRGAFEAFQGISAFIGGGISGGGGLDFDPDDFVQLMGSFTDILMEGQEPETRGLRAMGGSGALALRGITALVKWVPGKTALAITAGIITLNQFLDLLDNLHDVFDDLSGESAEDAQWALVEELKKLTGGGGEEPPAGSIEEILRKALLFTDADDKEKSILYRALLRRLDVPEPPDPAGKIKSLLQDLDAKLEALQYNDEELDLGPLRIWLRSRLIEY